MSQPRIAKSLYRIAKTFPPGDDEYQTAQDRLGELGEHIPEAVRRSWDALSAYDTEAGARKRVKAARKGRRPLGDLIVRYDIPEGSGLTYEPSLGPGHYDIRGDVEELKRYLSDDYTEV